MTTYQDTSPFTALPDEEDDARAREAYGAGSRVAKLLEIHQEDPGRIHVVPIRERVGF